MLACRRRPDRVACLGLLHVVKLRNASILVYCPRCSSHEFVIQNWEDTPFAAGPADPVHYRQLSEDEALALGQIVAPVLEELAPDDDALSVALRELGSGLTATQVRAILATATSPTGVLAEIVFEIGRPPPRAAMERFLPALVDAWNCTRDELGGVVPVDVREVGGNARCPCGSGRKFKRCCLAQDRLH